MIGRAAIIAIVAAGLAVAGCESRQTQTAYAGGHYVDIFASEDLSGPPISEPISTLVISRSAGWVCYASDRTGQDRTQYYVSCADAMEAGAHIAPVS